MAKLGNTTFTGNVIGLEATFTKLIKDGCDNTSILLAGGGHKPLSELSAAHTHPYLSDTHPASGVTSAKISNWDTAYTHSQTPHNYASSSSAGGPADYVRWESGLSNVNRRIPYAYGDNIETTDTRVRLVYSNSFQYNPSTNVLTVGSITGSAGSVAWANITGKPTSFTPADHTHSRFNNSLTLSSVTNDSAGGGDVQLELWRGTNASWQFLNSSGTLYIRSNYSSSKVGYGASGTGLINIHYSSGNITTNGAFYANSDIRYKDVIENINPSIEDISNLPIFKYKWNNRENDIIHLGSSAQSVEQILPELITVDGNDFKSLDYATLGTITSITAAREIVKLKEEIKRLNNIIIKIQNDRS